MNGSNNNDPNQVSTFWYTYPREVLEAIIVILIIQGVMDRSVDLKQVLRISCVIGLITYIAGEMIDTTFNKSIKDGLKNSVGLLMFSSIAL